MTVLLPRPLATPSVPDLHVTPPSPSRQSLIDIQREIERYISEQRIHGPLRLAADDDNAAAAAAAAAAVAAPVAGLRVFYQPQQQRQQQQQQQQQQPPPRPLSSSSLRQYPPAPLNLSPAAGNLIHRYGQLSRQLSKSQTWQRPAAAQEELLRAIFDTPECRTESPLSRPGVCQLRRRGATFRRVEQAVVDATERRFRRWARHSTISTTSSQHDLASPAGTLPPAAGPEPSQSFLLTENPSRLSLVPSPTPPSPALSLEFPPPEPPMLKRRPSSCGDASWVRNWEGVPRVPESFFPCSPSASESSFRSSVHSAYDSLADRDTSGSHSSLASEAAVDVVARPIPCDTLQTALAASSAVQTDGTQDTAPSRTDVKHDGDGLLSPPCQDRSERRRSRTIPALKSPTVKALKWLSSLSRGPGTSPAAAAPKDPAESPAAPKHGAWKPRAHGSEHGGLFGHRLFPHRMEAQEIIDTSQIKVRSAAPRARSRFRPHAGTRLGRPFRSLDLGRFSVPDLHQAPPARAQGGNADGGANAEAPAPACDESLTSSPLRMSVAGSSPSPRITSPEPDERGAQASPARAYRARRTQSAITPSTHHQFAEDIDLTAFQMAISGPTGDYFMGGEGNPEVDGVDDIVDWFQSLGFESEGLLVQDGIMASSDILDDDVLGPASPREGRLAASRSSAGKNGGSSSSSSAQPFFRSRSDGEQMTCNLSGLEDFLNFEVYHAEALGREMLSPQDLEARRWP